MAVVASTWEFGVAANAAAYRSLMETKDVAFAAVEGVCVAESDISINSVGHGGLPNRDGVVECDAALMRGNDLNYGAVCAIPQVIHASKVAKLVLEHSPHSILVGEGALKFAKAQKENGNGPDLEILETLLTPASAQRWNDWKSKHGSAACNSSVAPFEYSLRKSSEALLNHDTIGLITRDPTTEKMAAVCSTSGVAFKHSGRVGDSAIIGSGLFVDDEVGAAVATGEGDLILRTMGCFLIIEMMRNNEALTPQEAVELMLRRVLKRVPEFEGHQMAFLCLDKTGRVGYATNVGPFPVCITDTEGTTVVLEAPVISSGSASSLD